MNNLDMYGALMGEASSNGIGGGLAQQPAQWTYPLPQPEPRWPNQMCELLAEAGRLLLEENNKLKARIVELEAPAQVSK